VDFATVQVVLATLRLLIDIDNDIDISDALACLHWLRVPKRIEFKIAILTYKFFHGLALGYLGPFTRVADSYPFDDRCVLSAQIT